MADLSRTVTVTDRSPFVTNVEVVEEAAVEELVDLDDGLTADIQSLRISEEDSDNSGRSADDDDINQEVEAANPLIIPVVSSCLFDYMDMSGLKTARLVCKAWADAGAGKLIKKSKLLIDGDTRGKQYSSFTTILGQSCTNRFQSYMFKNLKAGQLKSILKSSGKHIKVFWPVNGRTASNYIYKIRLLRRILLECPNLEDLVMFCFDDEFSSPTATIFHPEDARLFKVKTMELLISTLIHPNVLSELINACPELRSFGLFSLAGAAITTLLTTILLELGLAGRIRLDQLDELKLGCLDKYAMSLLRRQKLNLAALEMFFMTDLDQTVVEGMLEHLSGTLKSFTCEQVHTSVITYPLIFPATMTKLDTIEIHSNNNFFFVTAIQSALKLRNLSTLLLFGSAHFNKSGLNTPVPFNPDFDTCWSLMELDLNRDRCRSLRTLQIPFGLEFGEVFTEIATVFPNVTDLRLQDSSADVIAAVFANCTNLQRLSIKMHSFPANMDSVLTGLKPKWCTTMLQKKKFKFVNSAAVTHKRAGLKDMKRLKYFELREQVNSSHLTEVSLYHGLAYLTRAVQLDLQGCQQFTEGGIEELKSALGPCCFVNINREEGGDYFWSYPKELYSR